MNNKPRKTIGEMIQSIIKKFDLYTSFNLLNNSNKNKAKNLGFPDQVEKIAAGFYKFQTNLKVGLYPKNNREISEFYRFVLTANHVLTNCTNEMQVEHLKKQLKEKCKNTDVLRGFYYELKILSKLLNDGFRIETLPESTPQEYPQGVSIPDGIVSKNDKLLQIECKTVSASIGHPIIQSAANKFLELLLIDNKNNEMCPKDHYCHIEFVFDKRLVNAPSKRDDQDVYMPEELFHKFKLDLKNERKNVKINTNQRKNVVIRNIMNDVESSQSFRISYLSNNNLTHQLTLTSSVSNSFAEKIYDIINKAVTSPRKDNYPLIFCLELYDFVYNNEFKECMMRLFHKHYDKLIWVIISDRAEKEHITWQEDILHGRKPIEFCTKSMTNFLNSVSA